MKFGFHREHHSVWPVAWSAKRTGCIEVWFPCLAGRGAPAPARGPTKTSCADNPTRSFKPRAPAPMARTPGPGGMFWKPACRVAFISIERLMRANAPRRRATPAWPCRRTANVSTFAPVAPNVLDRAVRRHRPAEPASGVADFTCIWTAAGLALCRSRRRSLLAPRRRLVDEGGDDTPNSSPTP